MMDSLAMTREGVSGIFLMDNAGKAIAEAVKAQYINHYSQDPVLIICGKGNNGGDGFAAALYLNKWNIPHHIYALTQPDQIEGDAKHFHDQCVVEECSIVYGDTIPDRNDWALVVDAILGTGFHGELRDSIRIWTRWMNATSCPIIAADIPTGIDSDNGQVSLDAVEAKITVTMGNTKIGLELNPGKSFAGKVEVADIGFPDVFNDLSGLSYTLFDESLAQKYLRKPTPDAYKYSMGRILIIAGSKGMTGAAILAGNAAIRSGGGLVKICIPASVNDVVESNVIEGITVPCDDNGEGRFGRPSMKQCLEQMAWCDAVLMGPGIGTHDDTIQVMKELAEQASKPMVIDADALRLFPSLMDSSSISVPLVITPHYGEWSRLINTKTEDIHHNLNSHLETFLQHFNGILHLKNAPSLTASKKEIVLNVSGNQGLASGGSGDVLAGIIVSLIAQKIPMVTAVQLAAYIHGKAADKLVTTKGYRGMIASDIIAMIPTIISDYEHTTG